MKNLPQGRTISGGSVPQAVPLATWAAPAGATSGDFLTPFKPEVSAIEAETVVICPFPTTLSWGTIELSDIQISALTLAVRVNGINQSGLVLAGSTKFALVVMGAVSIATGDEISVVIVSGTVDPDLFLRASIGVVSIPFV